MDSMARLVFEETLLGFETNHQSSQVNYVLRFKKFNVVSNCETNCANRPFSKMAAENSNKSKLKMTIPVLERAP